MQRPNFDVRARKQKKKKRRNRRTDHSHRPNGKTNQTAPTERKADKQETGSTDERKRRRPHKLPRASTEKFGQTEANRRGKSSDKPALHFAALKRGAEHFFEIFTQLNARSTVII